jgi:hypothetical protein
LVRLGSTDPEVKLRALREVKNQIIGNRTKKLSFLKLGAVPAVAAALSQAQADLLIQSAAVLGSFACGFDAGVRAVLDAGAFPNLINLLSYPDEKVMNMNSIPFFFFFGVRETDGIKMQESAILLFHTISNNFIPCLARFD